VNEAVVAAAVAAAGLNLTPAALGAWVWSRGDPGGGEARVFWIALRVGQLAALAFAIAIGVLAAAGHYSSEHLFYLYALLPLAVAFVAEQLRVVSAQAILDKRGLEGSAAVAALPDGEQHLLMMEVVRRELGVMALSAFVAAGLLLRAASTAHGI